MLRALILTTLTALALALSVWAQADPRFEEPSNLDQRFMQNQRETVDSLARRYLGERLRGKPEHDIAVLQEILDKRLVERDDRQTLQALGVVLGDLLQESENLEWVIYTDEKGRSRALRVPNTDEVLFPITMISRRVEADAEVDVKAVFEQAREIAEEVRYRQSLY